jgi:hypothetical protein
MPPTLKNCCRASGFGSMLQLKIQRGAK